jgi:hypothetical protein
MGMHAVEQPARTIHLLHRRLRQRICRNITAGRFDTLFRCPLWRALPDINKEGEIILTKEGPVIHEAIPKRDRSKLGIFVLDAQDEEDLSLTEDLYRQISHEWMSEPSV